MAATNTCVVEFLGGPLDGHQQKVSLSPHQLNSVALLPVGHILALLNRDRRYKRINELALYECLHHGHQKQAEADL